MPYNYAKLLGRITEKYGTQAAFANGVVLNRDETRLYFTDTPTRTVMCYRYDRRTGDVPDGVMLDRTETRLVIAEWYSGKLSVWDIARGCKTDELQLPVRHATSTVIGGEHMDWLFVATARDASDEKSPGGGIYRIRL